ncbi:ELL-associated factor [Paragonimus westermani]|uniref:ELL-associated factor n=1 Tax=Paragonimus westermani TaxID=34504 RepID=A0A5J4ND77_9TREM|nr:ELL-associated factor [Paragonimus westermani]
MQLNGTFDVKLGKSFMDPSSATYMTMRCDFMPASVDRTQPGTIKVDEGKELVVNLPNVASVGAGSTVFRGSARPVQKECMLIYNKRELLRETQFTLLNVSNEFDRGWHGSVAILLTYGSASRLIAWIDFVNSVLIPTKAEHRYPSGFSSLAHFVPAVYQLLLSFILFPICLRRWYDLPLFHHPF